MPQWSSLNRTTFCLSSRALCSLSLSIWTSASSREMRSGLPRISRSMRRWIALPFQLPQQDLSFIERDPVVASVSSCGSPGGGRKLRASVHRMTPAFSDLPFRETNGTSRCTAPSTETRISGWWNSSEASGNVLRWTSPVKSIRYGRRTGAGSLSAPTETALTTFTLSRYLATK